MFRGYRLASSSPPCGIAARHSSAAGSSRIEVATGGGSDANALIARGFEAVLLANGTAANHTPEESVTADAIVRDARRLRGDRGDRGRDGGGSGC